MNRKFNEDDVLRYVYGEMAEAEAALFREVLIHDKGLWQAYEVALALQSGLEEVTYQPSERSIGKIMHYAGTTARTTRLHRGARQPRKHWMRWQQLAAVVMTVCTLILCGGAFMAYNRLEAAQQQSGLSWDDSRTSEKLDLIQQHIYHLQDTVNAISPVYDQVFRFGPGILSGADSGSYRMFTIR